MTSWIDVAGWTLLHFVWQGAIIALFAALALHVLRAARPQLRYMAACAALGVMLAAPAVTALAPTMMIRMDDPHARCGILSTRGMPPNTGSSVGSSPA